LDWQGFAISDFSDDLSRLPPNVRPAKYRIDVKDHATAMAVRAALEAVEIAAAQPNPDPEDVLLWAEVW
jgi:hypothetical protein